MQTVLTIAGYDPSSGAGVTADLMVFAAHGLFGTSCITSLTVQSTLGVRATYPVETQTISETLACLQEDLPAAGIKIGMLGTAEAVEAVAGFLEAMRARGGKAPVVVDPVIRSSSGRELLSARGVDLLRSRLLPLADWVTPNLEEVALLTGYPVARREAARRFAEAFMKRVGGRGLNVLVTGGDLEPPDDFLLTRNGEEHWVRGTRVETTSTHGTGCALSSALLCSLVHGHDGLDAVLAAKTYVTEALRRAGPIGHGRGPMNHLWPLRKD
jgi:hydroxymethylpyrimidine/phosphomethylpyrimidine kinase